MKQVIAILKKAMLWTLGTIVVLVLLAYILIRLPAVQDYARKKVVSYLENAIGTPVRINRLSITFPKKILLEGVYFEDMQGDTLFAGDTLLTDIGMFQLLFNKVDIRRIDLRGITANIDRSADSVFNFDYIIDSLSAGETAKPDTGKPPMEISLGKIRLDRIHFHFLDSVEDMEMLLALGHFETRVRKFDLQKRQFRIGRTTLVNSTARMYQNKPPKAPESESEDVAESMDFPNLDLEFGPVNLHDVDLIYQNTISQIEATAGIGDLVVIPDKLNIPEKEVSVRSVTLENSNFDIALGASRDAEVLKEEVEKEITIEFPNWKFTLSELDLNNIAFAFDDQADPPAEQGIDFSHLDIPDLNFNAEDLEYLGGQMRMTVNSASLQDHSGLHVDALRGDLFFGEKEAFAREVSVKTGSSTMSADIELNYPSRDKFLSDPLQVQQKISIRDGRIAFADILFFAPSLKNEQPFHGNQDEVVFLECDLQGRLDDLEIGMLTLEGFKDTKINASGSISGLPDMNRVQYDLDIREFATVKTDIYSFIPEDSVEQYVQLPEKIGARGKIKGNLNTIDGNIRVTTSDGNVLLDGKFDWTEPYRINGTIELQEVNAGIILPQDTTIGFITMQVKADINGTDLNQLNGSFSGNVERLDFNAYSYHGLEFEGTIDTGAIAVNGSIDNDNLHLTFNADMNIADSIPELAFNLDLGHADLYALQFTDKQLTLSAGLHGDFTSFDPDSLNGSLDITSITAADSLRVLHLDSISLVSRATADSNVLTLRSGFLDLEMRGQYSLSDLPLAFSQSLNRYFEITGDTIVQEYVPQVVALDATITYSPVFSQIDSNIQAFSPMKITGRYQSENDIIEFTGNSEKITYSSVNFNDLHMEADTKEEELTYAVSFNGASFNNYKLRKSILSGKAWNDKVLINLQIKDEEEKDRFLIRGIFRELDNNYALSLDGDSLILNYEQWSLEADNSIVFGKNGLFFEKIVLLKNEQRLSIYSDPPQFSAPLIIDFRDFQIETLSEIVSGDSLLAGGIITGETTIRDYATDPSFNADLHIENFSFRDDTLGNIDLTISNKNANTLTASIDIEGNGNRVSLEGDYTIDNQSIDLTANVGRLQLASIQGFSMGAFTDAQGTLSGDLDVKGTIFKPIVSGDLRFDNAGVHITKLNAFYVLKDEGLRFENSDIHFEDFTLNDAEGNTLTVNGVTYTRTFSSFEFDLSINSTRFKVLDTDSRNGELYYGTLYLNTDIRLKGPLNNPEVEADLSVLEDTKMTVIIPQEAPGIVEREGVVRFVDLDNLKLDSLLRENLDSLNTFEIKGITAFATIHVNEEAEFKLIIDQGSGDFLQLRGNAELSASIDKSGKITLTGNYLLEQGVYELSFNFLKRRFEIEKGSSITWNGEPTSGESDITAVYNVEAAPIDLVERQLAGASQSKINLYKEELPFQLVLKLTGELDEPEVTFNIRLPEGNYPVAPEVIATTQAKLQQLRQDQSELNKQAFALVLLNRFISDNPFRSRAGTTPESYARQSASKLLSQQLNNLAGDLISGVDLRFDLESVEDYSTGELQNRTDLNITASKRLLNDRLEVTVGSNFEIEGPSQTNEQTSGIAGDVSVEYQLSKDGRYLLTAYRKNEYQVAVEGQVIETGLSFVIQLDYDKFREIFNNSQKKKKRNN